MGESWLGEGGARVRPCERLLESSLYLPVKRFLEKLGFEVKGEVCGCDLVALDGNVPAAVVIGELKLTFTLDLVLQAVDRSAACDEVWLAVRASRRSRILEEHRRRQGDPAKGGSTRQPIMTAYRQQALACAVALARGPTRPRDLKPNLPDAPKILLHNVYGWFVRVERGVYALSEAGRAALVRWSGHLAAPAGSAAAGPAAS